MQIKDLSKVFGDKTVLSHVSLSLDSGIYALTGDSGSGKTTLLRIIAGLCAPDTGSANAEGSVAMMFQDDRLFPWLSASENVQAAQNNHATDKAKADELLSSLGLAESLNAYPGELSGGMKRRTALARTLYAERDVLLLDEPFTGLDKENIIAACDAISKSKAKLVIIASHNLSLVPLSFAGMIETGENGHVSLSR
ncbi:MAG TPA: ATP-binding cassette domain-containing protein [Bacillota bacterium]|nr:ATP-binding cassette domain-containing protein [Bacillota bacterium]